MGIGAEPAPASGSVGSAFIHDRVGGAVGGGPDFFCVFCVGGGPNCAHIRFVVFSDVM